ncbi:hypothetical protein [Candidatus Methanoperedens nitratireducens]|uniref:Uncharacterized protein n=1 Tax=Candidatus Methanoperedens nitratireducens TaxID=1392998 RepID=A0A284VRZ7_9EURY|nr:hypothetical protein [Candidatus Methanoperedens nitroreducens]SNQ62054.1 hypothetical protein MNV_580002 [Candidatus Methanoperedens nitroreducens]
MDSPFNGVTQAKIVDPAVLINAIDRKFKAWLSSFQVTVFARSLALQRYYSDQKVDVVKAFIDESIELSGSVNGKNVEGYIKVANTRVYVADKKRTTTLETENSV